MLRLILLYMIGQIISAPTSYWVVYTLACMFWAMRVICEFIEAGK